MDSDCVRCNRQNTGEDSIQCDLCDCWTHFGCAKLDAQQVERIINYFCESCRDDEHLITWRRVLATEEQRVMKSKHYYEVASIKGHRNSGAKREFLVEWQDCPVKEGAEDNVCTWEPEKNLDGAIDFLQRYCQEKSIKLSEITGLLGADRDQDDHNVDNWVTLDTILEKLTKVRAWTKLASTLEASKWAGFEDTDHLYFLEHDKHCFVILYVHNRDLAFIADGGNVFRNNKEVADQLKKTLGIRLVSLEFDQQLGIDHCGSSAVLIGLELLRMHSCGIKFQQLLASREVRRKLIQSMHASPSKLIKAHSLRQHRKALTCKFCKKSYKSNQSRALSMHITRVHKK